MSTVLGIAVGLLVAYVAALAALVAFRPDGVSVRTALRLLPDLLRLLKRLATDPAVPRRARAALWLLLVYLAMPIDLVPDVIPVIGYADDAILVVLVLRYVARRAGPDVVRRLWPGEAATLRLVAGS
ncbi:MAG: DUF1232 domain-containing protein [Solirubrobacteraceae bacterium]|nr:DUF1232 domain-containing protein [Solirubrobacteraceae bacterium]